MVLRQGLQVVKVQGGKQVTVQAKGALPSLHIHAIQNGEVETGQVCLQTAQLARHLGIVTAASGKGLGWWWWCHRPRRGIRGAKGAGSIAGSEKNPS